MKLIHAGIIFSVIVLLFVIWNRDILFHAKGTKRIVKKIKEAKIKSGKLKTAKSSYKINNDNDNNDNNDNDNDNENDNDINRITDSINKISKSILSDILSLNQAAHTLTRNGAILDKLIKDMKGEEACGVLMREYDLSSLMIMVVRRDEGEGVKEGFKKINLKAKEEDESESDSKSASASVINKIESSSEDPNLSESNKNKDKLKIYSKNKNNDHDQSIDIPNNDNEFIHNDPHHTTPSDPLRIALYCKNLGREAGVGRVVRVVQSVADKDEKYVVELIK